MPDFTQLLKAVVDLNEADTAACLVLREVMGDQLRTWEPTRMERLRSTAIEERRRHGDQNPEATLDSLLNGTLSEPSQWPVPTALGPPPPDPAPQPRQDVIRRISAP